MERERPDSVANHSKKMMIAASETGLFGLIGLIYPPAYLGMIVTGVETLRQQTLAFKLLEQKICRLEADVDELARAVDAHIRLRDADEDEPIPPDPQTATPEQIKAYKEAVFEAATKPQPKK
jgi:hypothetical protein